MSIYGIGIDIIDNNRIKKNLFKKNSATLNSNLFKREINSFLDLVSKHFINEKNNNEDNSLNYNINKNFLIKEKEKIFKKFFDNSIINFSFLTRIYTLNEIKLSLIKKNYIEYFSSRYAAKEACVKALKRGFGRGISYKTVEIVIENEIPQIKLNGEIENEFKNKKFHLSLSHEKKYSSAIVIIEN